MKNANLPAMANSLDVNDACALGADSTVIGVAAFNAGLTKREYFAGLAMQAIVSNKHQEIKWWPDDIKQQNIATAAAGYADALLAELERTK